MDTFYFSIFLRLTWKFLGFESECGGSVCWPNNKIIDRLAWSWTGHGGYTKYMRASLSITCSSCNVVLTHPFRYVISHIISCIWLISSVASSANDIFPLYSLIKLWVTQATKISICVSISYNSAASTWIPHF